MFINEIRLAKYPTRREDLQTNKRTKYYDLHLLTSTYDLFLNVLEG